MHTTPRFFAPRAVAAISGIESGGRYNALGPVTKRGDRAYGKYQVMGSNIPVWTRKYLGREMTPEQFLASPQAQDAVFKARFGEYAHKYGPEGAAKAWFAGERGMNDPNRTDQLGTSVEEYGSRFAQAYGGANGTDSMASPLPPIRPVQAAGVSSVSGRPIYYDPSGGVYSEKTVTFPIEDKWFTFPSVDATGREMTEKQVADYVRDNGPIDPITGERFPSFNSRQEAENYARQRSQTRLPQKFQNSASPGLTPAPVGGAIDMTPSLQQPNMPTPSVASVWDRLGQQSGPIGMPLDRPEMPVPQPVLGGPPPLQGGVLGQQEQSPGFNPLSAIGLALSAIGDIQEPGANYLANALGIQRAMREDAEKRRLAQQGKVVTAGGGLYRVLPSGELQTLLEPTPDMPNSFEEFQRAQENPDYRNYLMERDKSRSTNVNVNTGPTGIDYGEPEKGLVWARNPDGTVKLDERGAPIAVPYQGGSVFREKTASEEAQKVKQEQTARYNDIVLDDIDRVMDRVADADIPVTGAGSLLSSLPGTAAKDVSALLDTIRANIGFDRLQQMREASPTGGALGQVSEMENRLLQSTLGSLEQSQSQEQFLYNLKRLKDLYLDIVHGPGNRPEKKRSDEELLKEYGIQ